MTLAELIVSLALTGVLLGAVFGLLETGLRVHAFGAGRVESQQNARIALDRLAREIRQAGFGAPSFPALSIAEPARLVLHLDLNRDGVIAGNGETITWRLAGRVLRRDAGGGAQPVIDGVRDLAFTYFDADGAATARPEAVRSVGMRLTTEPAEPAADRAWAASTTLVMRVRLRNR
jgi:type II secretory pathway component PulJ